MKSCFIFPQVSPVCAEEYRAQDAKKTKAEKILIPSPSSRPSRDTFPDLSVKTSVICG